MRSLILALMGVVFFLAPSEPGVAQTSSTWELIPQIGLYFPMTDVGAVATASSARYLRVGQIQPTLSFGLAAEFPFPSDRLTTNFRALATLPSDAPGSFDCFPPDRACELVLIQSKARFMVIAAMADVLFRPFSPRHSVLPFTVVGLGLKHDRFSWPTRGSWVEAGNHTDTSFSLHWGIGCDFDFWRFPFRVELSDYWTPAGDRLFLPDGEIDLSTRRKAQHDLTVTLGWRLNRA